MDLEIQLLLLISRHSSGIVDPLLLFVSQSLIGLINLCKFFLGSCSLVDIWMVLFSQFEISFLDITWLRASIHI